MGLRIAVIGDVHFHWDDQDAALLDAAGYDLVVFVGDLAGLRLRGTLEVAAAIGRLQTPVLVVPGNHDAPNAVQLLGEVLGSRPLIRLAELGTEARRERIARALGPGRLAGYSIHDLGDDVQIVAGRPHSMGGGDLSFAPFLAQAFGVHSLAESAERLCALVAQTTAPRLIFVGHNGPTGLGDRRDAIWGCDFRSEEGDFGDPDLAAAIAFARESGKEVLAVIAGHMHRRLRGGGERVWQVERDGVVYVNAAQVPRIWTEYGQTRRHHVAVSWDGVALRAQDVIW